MNRNTRPVPALAIACAAALCIPAQMAHCQAIFRPIFPPTAYRYLAPRAAPAGANVGGVFSNGVATPYRSQFANVPGNSALNQFSAQATGGTNSIQANQSARSSGTQQGSQAAAQDMSSTITARFTAADVLFIAWSGATSGVRSVTFGTFDSNLKMLNSTVVTQAPYEASFSLIGNASRYGVRVEYTNGTINTVYTQML